VIERLAASDILLVADAVRCFGAEEVPGVSQAAGSQKPAGLIKKETQKANIEL
jgi:hypothetical protein